MLTVFCSYAHEDEALRKKLEIHLASLQPLGPIQVWHDRDIPPGADWRQTLDTHLEEASIILLLVSPNFLASNYCNGVEVQRALQRHERGEARVIPILLRPANWEDAPFAYLQCLPRNCQPVTKWRSQNEAFVDITQGIRALLPTPQPGPLPPPPEQSPEGFSVRTLEDGQVVQANIPFEIQGTCSSKESGDVWVILEDSLGQYYLQNPPIRFQGNGEWIAKNIRAGKGIEMVDFVHANRQAHQSLRQMVQQMMASDDWKAFYELPPGSTLIQSIRIDVQSGVTR